MMLTPGVAELIPAVVDSTIDDDLDA